MKPPEPLPPTFRKSCTAVSAESGLRCRLLEHPGNNHANERGHFTAVLQPGALPARVLELAHVATTQDESHFETETKGQRQQREAGARYRANRKLRGEGLFTPEALAVKHKRDRKQAAARSAERRARRKAQDAAVEKIITEGAPCAS